ncbi:MAG: uroporphyrinogen-III C-methyltransferase [Thermoguttaceae bacterium]|nr:uroporphyrinogen-III C-methyltransferase [Thermoguttaceae bacterium]
MAFVPFFIDVAERKALVVGGGKTALAKLRSLIGTGLKIKVVAPEICPEIEALRDLDFRRRPFEESDVSEDLLFVVSAANDRVNENVARICRKRRVLVNAVDDPGRSSFICPAVLRKGALMIAASTGGSCPSAAAGVRDAIAESLSDSIDEIVDALAEYRSEIKRRVVDGAARRRINKRLWNESNQAGRPLGREEFERVVSEELESSDGFSDIIRLGRVALVGAGAGPRSLMTLRAVELLKSADVVLFDELIDKSVLEWAPTGAELLSVGKRCGDRGKRQEAINALMIEKARQGARVVRLKGGDPFLFGRGGEEAMALAKAGIPYEIVPGITSALYIPMEAGIPVTTRGESRSVRVLIGRPLDALEKELESLVDFDGTAIFLMATNSLEFIANRLIELGKDEKTPVAVLSGGCARHKTEARGTLKDVVQKAKEANAEPPTVIVIGSVAKLDLRDPSGTRRSKIKDSVQLIDA